MITAPETARTKSKRNVCDGANDILANGLGGSAALGHPRVFIEIDDSGAAECGYCDKRFVLIGGPADTDA